MDRRQFLALGRGAAAAAGLLSGTSFPGVAPPAHAAGSPSTGGDTPEAQLARFALAIRYETLPAEVIDSLKRVVLDTLGCAVAAFGSEAATIAERVIRTTSGQGQAATILGHAHRATLEGAIFVNGVLVRSLDLNDTYIGTDPLHPSELLPTALAACEAGGLTGRQFIEALAAGYEIAARVNDALSFMDRGFHPLCAMSYAAPAILGKAWNLPEAAIGHAIGLAAARGYTSFVVNSGAISMMKSMGFAAAATDAVLMTRLAAHGFTGPSGTLEWAATRFKPGAPPPALDLQPANHRLPRVAFKRFPVQIELQAVVEAGVRLSRRLGARASGIREIRVLTYPGIIQRVADPAKFRPQTRGTADHSLPVCLAMALLDGNVTVAQFEADRWRAADVMNLVQRTVVSPGAELMARHPRGRGCSVEIIFNDETTDQETVPVAEGDAGRPVSTASLVEKFMSFVAPVLGDAKAQDIVAAIQSLESVQNLEALTALLRPRLG